MFVVAAGTLVGVSGFYVIKRIMVADLASEAIGQVNEKKPVHTVRQYQIFQRIQENSPFLELYFVLWHDKLQLRTFITCRYERQKKASIVPTQINYCIFRCLEPGIKDKKDLQACPPQP
jgi:hypothetical protein